MKNDTEIRDRAKALVTQAWKARLATLAERLPVRCKYNHRHPLDTRRTVGGQPNPQYNSIVHLPMAPTIGLCMLGSEDLTEWSGTICEDPLDAQACPSFTRTHSVAEAMAEFQAQLSDREWVTTHHPELAALLWVLSEPTPRPPWWRRVLALLFPPVIPRTLPSSDPIALLGASE